jgi:hypothetical protein
MNRRAPLRQAAGGQGLELLERALALTPAGDSEHRRVLLRFADASSQAGRFADDAGERGLGDQEAALRIAEVAVALRRPNRPGAGLAAAFAQVAAAQVVSAKQPAAIVSCHRVALAAELDLPVPARALACHGVYWATVKVWPSSSTHESC